MAKTSFVAELTFKVMLSANTIVLNTLLDSASDATLIISELAKMLKLKGEQQKLDITNAKSKSVSVTLKFSEFSTHHLINLAVNKGFPFNGGNCIFYNL